MISRRLTPRPPALWKSIQDAKTPPTSQKPRQRQLARRAIPRGPTPSKKAIWTQAFPEQMTAPSAKHTAERRLYRIEARAFVQAAIKSGKTCPVVAAIAELRNGTKYGHPISAKLSEVHHQRGRLNGLLRDQRHWLAVSKQGHYWIHSPITEARRRGFICAQGDWNKP